MTFLLLLPLLLLASAVFSGSETGLYSVNRVKLGFRAREGHLAARWLRHLLHPPGPMIIAVLIMNNIITETIAYLAEHLFADLAGERWSVLCSTAALTPLVLVFGEFVPKQLFRLHADALMYPLAYPLTVIRWALAVPVFFIGLLTRVVQWLIPGRPVMVWEPYASRLNLRSFLRTRNAEKALSPFQQRMVDRILALERMQLTYEGISKPIAGIASLDAGLDAAAARGGLGPKYYQRYLVRREGKPIGYISAAALVTAGDDALLGDLAQPLPSLPATLPIHEAIQRMHAAGSDLALVTDGAGRPIRIAFRNDALRVLANLED